MTSLARTPLDHSVFAADAQKALASPQSKMMAARGLIPVARPRDLLAVLYQLSIDPDEKIAGAATASAKALPDPVLRGGLADHQLDARVLDLFAGLLTAAPAAREIIIGNPATADETMAAIAARGGAAEIDLIATNEQRLLRAPAIIAAMYQNRAARMSTVDRVVELAVRNGVKVPGIPAWEEIQKIYASGERAERVEGPPDQIDAQFARAAGVNAGKAADAEPGTPTELDGKVFRGELARIADPAERERARARFIAEYRERFANPYKAASLGYIDEILRPRDTRAAIIRSLRTLANKRQDNPPRKHGNIPL